MNKPIIYQLFVRLFGNTNSKNKTFGSIDENGCGKFNHINHKALEALKDFGISHIWLTGVIEHATCTNYSRFNITPDHPATVKGRAGSPYAIKDYFDIDPDLAVDVNNRMQEFEDLLQRIHHHGMKAIIDFVPNHVSRQYASDVKPTHIPQLGQNDNPQAAFAPNNNFYYIPNERLNLPEEIARLPYTALWNQPYEELPAKATGNDCFSSAPSINDWYETIKLNYGIDYRNGNQSHFHPIPDTWHRMEEILSFWAHKGVDGFRCDMAEMVPVEFWSWVIPKIKIQFPHILFVAEIYNPARYHDFIHTAGFDYLYDKVGLYDVLRDVLCHHKDAASINHILEQLFPFDKQMLRFIENHDEQRVASSHFAGDPNAGLAASAICALAGNGPFMIYNGQETGEEAQGIMGFSGDDGRTSIFDYCSMPMHAQWVNNLEYDGASLSRHALALRNCYRSILQLLHAEDVFSTGHYYSLMWSNPPSNSFPSDKVFAFFRYNNQKCFLVLVSLQNTRVALHLKIPEHAFQHIPALSHTSINACDRLYNGEKFSIAPHDWQQQGKQLFLEPFALRAFEISGE